SREHDRAAELPICREIGGHLLGEIGPLVGRDRAARPAVVPCVDPAVPECEGDVQLRELGRGALRKLVLEAIEAPADRRVALGAMSRRVATQLLDECVPRRRVIPHDTMYTRKARLMANG